MRALLRVFVGLLLVTVDLNLFIGFDVLPDPIGWLMVISGVGVLARRHRAFGVAEGFAIAGLLGSLVAFVPQTESVATFFGALDALAQTGFTFAVCTGLLAMGAAGEGAPRGADVVRWADLALTLLLVPFSYAVGPVGRDAVGTLVSGGTGLATAVLALVVTGLVVRLWFLGLLWSSTRRSYAVV